MMGGWKANLLTDCDDDGDDDFELASSFKAKLKTFLFSQYFHPN